MSDTKQGEGWWQASDGKWYPPEARPAAPSAAQAPPPPSAAHAPGWWQASDGAWYPPEARPAPFPPAGFTGPAQMRNGMGTTALVLGIVGLLVAIIPYVGVIAFPLAVLAIVFGGLGVRRANRREADNRGMAIAGLVTGIIAFLWIILVIAAISSTHT